MALFQKKPQVSDNLPLYTLGLEKKVLVIGLGNPGKKFDGTRHNVGFAAVDLFAAKNDFPKWVDKRDLKCQLAVNNIAGTRVILCKPQTFMNLSGQAAQAVQAFYKLANSQTLAVYDELALPFGQLRTRMGGSDAGHNGVKSLIQHLGEDFGRLRIGVGNQLAARSDAAGFVLDKFAKTEQPDLAMVLREANALMAEYMASGKLTAETRNII